MKFNQFRFIFPLLSILLLSSCLGTTNAPTAPSTNARFVSLTFGTSVSNPNISTARFTLNADSITIENVDSLPFKTRIDSVQPTFTFVSYSKSILVFSPGYKYNKDTLLITGKDTVDFRQPVTLINYAADGIAHKDYKIKVNVHQVNPELYVWTKVKDVLYTPDGNNQRAVLFNNKFLFYVNNNTNNYLYTSSNGYDWTSATVSGMPANNNLRNIVEFNSKLYFTLNGTTIYTSTDGLTWTSADYTSQNYTFISLLFNFNGKLWAVTQNKTDQAYYFATSTDGSNWNFGSKISSNFPISDYSALSFSTRNGKPKVLVIGGYSATGTLLNTRWSTEDGIIWLDFSVENSSLPAIAGASVISYDSKILLIGGKNESNATLVNPLRESIDEGLSWSTPDSTKNYLPNEFQPRFYQSALVDKSNRIFIVGGQNQTTTFKDVWTGKLNRKSFIRQ